MSHVYYTSFFETRNGIPPIFGSGAPSFGNLLSANKCATYIVERVQLAMVRRGWVAPPISELLARESFNVSREIRLVFRRRLFTQPRPLVFYRPVKQTRNYYCCSKRIVLTGTQIVFHVTLFVLQSRYRDKPLEV